MDMIERYKKAMRLYADFSGRATRSDFWLFTLALILLLISASFVELIVLGNLTGGLIAGLINLLHIVPALAISVRRLHDTGKSGWWLLLMFVPVIGTITLLVFYCTKSDPAPNRYGS